MEENIGGLLVESGHLKPADLDRAMRLRAGSGQRLSSLLVSLGLIKENDLAHVLAEKLALEITPTEDYSRFPETKGLISPDFLRQVQAIPILEGDGHVKVTIANPFDKYAIDALQLALGHPVSVQVGRVSEIEAAIEKCYGHSSPMAQITPQTNEHHRQDADDIQHLRDLASEAPIIRAVNLLISKALSKHASDIHIEPFNDTLKIRYRVDGVLHDVEAPPARSADAILSRIKVMADLNIAERRLPQDGRIMMRFEGREVDVRISFIPTAHGESVVLRLLDRGATPLDFQSLGFQGQIFPQFEQLLERPQGIVLVTGPTGSGKTTTLYTILQKLNTPEVKILTVEDPVEYRMEGINQVHVRPDLGLTFANALRSFLRQDPDIIMVGEMRDLETAKIAVQSALTGHKVFSTLHTNDAASSITRLLDMGVEDYLVSSTVNGIIAQRLVRTLCSHCKRSHKDADALIKALALNCASADPKLYQPIGCEQCDGTGYKGRTGIVELLMMTDCVRQAILDNSDASHLRSIAREEGVLSLREDGLHKAMQGVTTIEEVDRVTREPE